MTETYIIGDSQTRALMHAANAWTGDALPPMRLMPLGSAVQFWEPFYTVKPASIELTPDECASRMQRVFGTTEITNERLWGFCLGFTTVGFFRYGLWEQYSLHDRNPRGRHVISKAAAAQIARGMFEEILKFYELLIERGYAFFVISGAPLPQHNPHLKEAVREDVIFADKFYRDLYAKELSAHGIDFILPPDEVKDHDGLLLPQYRHPTPDDRHHANKEYGALMLARVVDYIRARLGKEATVIRQAKLE